MKKKICFIGNISDSLDGQTIKTKILYDNLLKESNWDIKLVNTYKKSKNPIYVFLLTFFYLFRCKNVIILVSKNGRKFYFPILYFFSKVFKRKVYHDVIGGNLPEVVHENKKMGKYINSFEKNWVETNRMKDALEKEGVNNCEVIPNFKDLEVHINTNINWKINYKFCTFSRVIKEKGISDAIDAIMEVNKQNNLSCKLDIYGQIDDSYKKEFEDKLKESKKHVEYKGVIQFDKSVDVLKNYYALLFPTYWPSEGCPGTVIDAFAAGLPVIATDWNCNSEIINDYKTGIIYPNKEIKNLYEAIMWSLKEKDKMKKMSKNCNNELIKYVTKTNINRIITEINGGVTNED